MQLFGQFWKGGGFVYLKINSQVQSSSYSKLKYLNVNKKMNVLEKRGRSQKLQQCARCCLVVLTIPEYNLRYM